MDRNELIGQITEELLISALDDNGDGQADEAVWAAVVAAADKRLQAIFGGPTPPRHELAAGHARRLFVLTTLYNRRGFTGEANPYTAAADRAEKHLMGVAGGEVSTDAGSTEPVFVGQPTRAAGMGRLMA